MYFLQKDNLPHFLHNLIASQEVVGPKAKGNKFIFDFIKKPEDIRLDYDTTLLPPKKFFIAPHQDLIKFSSDKIEDCIQPKKRILFGVHPYDIKGIRILDTLFRENKEDWNYLANRENTAIVGLNVKNISPNAFFDSMKASSVSVGYDLFFTDIEEGYLVEVSSEKGKDILSSGLFSSATQKQIQKGKEVIQEQNCTQKVPYPQDLIARKMKDSFNSPLWVELAKRCFSCGSCNIVCPTCYCFDVQDVWNIDQQSGVRFRTWDGCLTEDFAQVSVQGGKENFREDRASRFRHRIMRKTAYLNPKIRRACLCRMWPVHFSLYGRYS